MLPVTWLAGVWVADDSDREWRDQLRRAFDAAGLSDKQIALLLGIPKSQLSDQMALRGHLSWWRLRRLPKEFRLALARQLAAAADAHVLEKSELLDLVMTVKHVARMNVTETLIERAG